jgi:hypothetical protein
MSWRHGNGVLRRSIYIIYNVQQIKAMKASFLFVILKEHEKK